MVLQLSAHFSQDKYEHTVEDVRIYFHTLYDKKKKNATTGGEREMKTKGFCEIKNREEPVLKNIPLLF